MTHFSLLANSLKSLTWILFLVMLYCWYIPPVPVTCWEMGAGISVSMLSYPLFLGTHSFGGTI